MALAFGFFSKIEKTTRNSPSLRLAEVKGHSAVGDGLLIDVLGVSPYERGHVIAFRNHTFIKYNSFSTIYQVE